MSTWADVLTPEQILEQFEQYASSGIIQYVLPTEPLGEQWVLGIEGEIIKLDTAQAACWLAGASALLRRLPRLAAML